MRKIYLIIGLIVASIGLIYLFWDSKAEIINYPPKNEKVVAFGDSLIAGNGSTEGNDLVTRLSEKLARPVINLGAPGKTSKGGFDSLGEVIAEDPGTVILLFGGNDFLQKVPRMETFKNLRDIIGTLQANGAMVVLLGIRGGMLSDGFDSDFEKLSEEMKVIYVPDVLDGLLGDSRYMSDTVHPNDLGYEMIAEKVYRAIEDYVE